MVVTHGAECIGLAVEGNFWFNKACARGGMPKPLLTAVWRDLVLLKWRVYLGLPNNLLHHAGGAAVGKFLGLAAVMEGQLFVVEAELVEEGGLIIVGGDLVDSGVVADFVGFAVEGAGLEAAASEPSGEALAVVVAAGFVSGLHNWQPANLAAPMYNSALEQAALF